ncbi:glutathione peroxidase [Megasphaera hutchinsoni]|jgi:hypothetical protein|uniref:Glutathione peroxidase n=1 Tax=Megasphaera hutchinsoni TaxID=1588748 RepID=A0A134CDX0_9FIRM|nr:glutathione peroxidase [Megasphaera hutchinsoni]KXB90402.1 glutathione peroxidase [Megasphaera hutchinsoni]
MSVYDYSVKDILGKEVTLDAYKGKVLLIVNTASKCGFTPQYDGLEALYKKYQDKGLVVLGFPCNQFLEQEPGDATEIQSFCKLNHGVTFPLFAKVDVRGENAIPLYKYLTEAAPFKGYELNKQGGQIIKDVVTEHYPDNVEGNGVKWNFTKFLISRDGKKISRFEPTTTPEELDEIIAATL